jgi:hypothetical protein
VLLSEANNDGEKRDLQIGVGLSRPTRKPIMIELSRYVFETLREDAQFAFCRGRRDDGELPTILLIAREFLTYRKAYDLNPLRYDLLGRVCKSSM